jgi:GWxTD domain-containing protein
MRKIGSILLILLLSVSYGEAKSEKGDLPERFRKWLEEEVVYIIGPREKEVFSKLENARDRDLFIEAFWKHRDPTPGTPENEFKTEHYRRIAHVNHFFGRTAPKPGWRTDRGRMYIILGEPNDIQRFEGRSQVYNSEVWFYQGKSELGLPPGFHLVFFQEGRVGEYRLYSPVQDGPHALMSSHVGDPADLYSAYERLREIEPGLAMVSLSLIPGDESGVFGRPSLSSDLLIQKVEMAPTRLLEERYAQKFLEYKDIVEVEYSTNYIDSNSLITVAKEPTGIYFVHYSIELDRLSVSEYQGKYSTTLKLNGTVKGEEEKIIDQFENTISLNLDQDQLKSVSHRPLSIRGMFPLIPGNYRISILLKNEVSKEFTSLERNVVIPDDSHSLQMTSLTLGFKLTNIPGEKSLKPFKFGSQQVYFQSNKVFTISESLIVAFQLHGLSPYQKENGELIFTFFNEGEEYRSHTKKIDQLLGLPNITETFSLADFLPAHYQIRVSLVVDGQEVFSDSDNFDITHSEVIDRPWIHTQQLPPPQDPVYTYQIGSQLFHSGRIREARPRLEDAFNKRPDFLPFAIALSRLYLKSGEYSKIESILGPFLGRVERPTYDLLLFMGQAYQKLGKLDKAIDVFNKAVDSYGSNFYLLNNIGECYFQFGKPKEALVVWTKSLELNPNQPQIKKNVDALKEKK